MILAKVISRVVSTAKSEGLPHRQLLTILPLPGFAESDRKVAELIAIDTVQAGPGDTVLVMQEGTAARQTALDDPSQPMPAQIVIVGIVDHVQTD